MKTLRLFKKENGKVISKQMEYHHIDYKESYVVITTGKKTHIVKNFENIICDLDDFQDLP